jgi:hypothetical protein
VERGFAVARSLDQLKRPRQVLNRGKGIGIELMYGNVHKLCSVCQRSLLRGSRSLKFKSEQIAAGWPREQNRKYKADQRDKAMSDVCPNNVVCFPPIRREASSEHSTEQLPAKPVVHQLALADDDKIFNPARVAVD